MTAAVFTKEYIARFRRTDLVIAAITSFSGKHVIGFCLSLMLVIVQRFTGEDGDFGKQAKFVIHLLLIQQFFHLHMGLSFHIFKL